MHRSLPHPVTLFTEASPQMARSSKKRTNSNLLGPFDRVRKALGAARAIEAGKIELSAQEFRSATARRMRAEAKAVEAVAGALKLRWEAALRASVDDVSRAAAAFRECCFDTIREYYDAGQQFSWARPGGMLALLEIVEKERPHTRCLSLLFDETKVGIFAKDFLVSVLQVACEVNLHRSGDIETETITRTKNLVGNLGDDPTAWHIKRVRREKAFGSSNRKPDMVLHLDIAGAPGIVIIENKFESGESADQTVDYFAEAVRILPVSRAPSARRVRKEVATRGTERLPLAAVFLDLHGRLPDCRQFLPITYGHLRRALKEAERKVAEHEGRTLNMVRLYDGDLGLVIGEVFEAEDVQALKEMLSYGAERTSATGHRLDLVKLMRFERAACKALLAKGVQNGREKVGVRRS